MKSDGDQTVPGLRIVESAGISSSASATNTECPTIKVYQDSSQHEKGAKSRELEAAHERASFGR